MHYGKKHDLPFGIMDVAGLLRLNIRRRAPGQVYVDCPICGDRRGKMNLNTEKDLWRCNYCGEGGGMLSLYLCTSNSVLSFILIFFIYLLFSLFPFPSPLFGTSLSGKIKASTLCTFFSFITTITIFAVIIVILHLAAIKNVKKLLSR